MEYFDALYYPYPSRRMLVYGQNGMVAASHPLAVQAGLRVLQQGGNAVDAALAVAAALTVVDPSNNGIGGDCFAIVSMDQKLYGLNASGFSPALMTPEAIAQSGHESVPLLGWLPVTVPGAPAGWAALSERFGRLPMARAFAPAIALAEGYPLSPGNAGVLNKNTPRFEAAGLPELTPWLDLYNPARRTFRPGERLAVPEMGRSLRLIAETGARALYEGELAERIDAHARATGGLIRGEDLSAYGLLWVDPISANYHGFDVYELPPNGQGLTALLALNILSGFDLKNHDDPETLHVQIEAVKLAFADTLRHIADPTHMRADIGTLLSPAYAASRRKLITDTAGTYGPGVPEASDTVYFCTADADGNSVSMIQSLFYPFGSGVVVPGTGIALQNRGNCFTMEAGHVNRVGPRKRPYHTIMPGFLGREGALLGPFGVVGGYMQPQAHVQLLSAMIDSGLNPQAAMDAPRFSWEGGLDIDIEPTYNPAVLLALSRRGHNIQIKQDRHFGRAQMILRDVHGAWCGASEPRGDGCALGY